MAGKSTMVESRQLQAVPVKASVPGRVISRKRRLAGEKKTLL